MTDRKNINRYKPWCVGIVVLTALFMLLSPQPAHAQCTGPAGAQGTLIYNDDYNIPQYCDGTNWIAATPPAGNVPIATSNGLIHHWTMDSLPPQDEVGSMNCSVANTAPAAVAGQDGGAAHFDNVSDDYDCGSVNATVSGLTKMTYAAWIKRNATGERMAMGTHDDANGQISLNYWDDGGVYCTVNAAGAGYEEVATALDDTEWHHITCVYDGTQTNNTDRLEIYVDGALVGTTPSGTLPTSIPAQTNNWAFGPYLGNDANGSVDDVRIYDRVLTDAEIVALYAATGGGEETVANQTEDGYFVEVSVSDANLGGLSGANSYCLSQLTSGTWTGKATAQANGQLVADKVRAWLCDSTECQNLISNKTYAYASNVSGSGGTTFTSTVDGMPEDDGVAYDDANAFNAGGVNEYFTGRSDTTFGPQVNTCSDWGSTSGSTDIAVSDTGYYPEKISKYSSSCGDADFIICMVDPLYEPYDFSAANQCVPGEGPFALLDTYDTPNYATHITGNGSHIFVSDNNNGLQAYTFDGTTISPAGATAVQKTEESFWDGSYIYTTHGALTDVRAFSYDGSTFTELDIINTTGTTNKIWGDGRYIYYNEGAALKAVSFDGESFSSVIDTIALPASQVYQIWGDGDYIFLANNVEGIRTFTFDGVSFSSVGYVSGGAGGCTADGIIGDGTYVYAGCGNAGMKAYSYDGSTFTELDNIDPGAQSQFLSYSDGKIFAHTGTLGGYAYTFDGADFTAVDDYVGTAATTGAPWSDGTYVYMPIGANGFVALGGFEECVCQHPGHLPAPEGTMIYNKDMRVPQYCDGSQWNTMAPITAYVPNAVAFDGIEDYIWHTSMSTHASTDTDKFTASFWIKPGWNNPEFNIGNIYEFGPSGRAQIRMDYGGNNTDNKYMLHYQVRNTSNAYIMQKSTTGTYLESGNWYHVLISVDTTNSIGLLYINDVDAENSESLGPGSGDIDFSTAQGIGKSNTSYLDASIADFWFAADTFIDFSVEANRRKFIDAAGNPVYLGQNGSKTTGIVPDTFLTGPLETWNENKGTGGGFPVAGGELKYASSSPGAAATGLGNPLAHWPLDDESSPSLDYGIAGIYGTWGNGPTYTSAGQVNGALSFDGVDQHLDIFTNSADPFDQIPLTLMMWLNFDELASVFGEMIPVMKHDSASPWWSYYWQYRVADDKLEISISDGGTTYFVESDAALNKQTWYHVSMVIDAAGDASMYVNGQLQADQESIGSLMDSDMYLGFAANAQNASEYMDGSFDDIRFYDRALTATEIDKIYDAGVLGKYPADCTNPDRAVGTMLYNTDGDVIQYCDGEAWRAVGQ